MPTHDPDKKKHKVQRLVDVDVSHVSLVDHPANRTPFKAIKRDVEKTKEGTPMNITLKNMFGARKPEITSVMANTAVKATAVAKMLMEGDEAILTETDGVHVVTKKGHVASDTDQVVHMGDALGVAYTISNVQKELALFDMEGTSFEDSLQAEAFVPGIFIGMDALSETIRKVAMDENTKSADDFKKGVATAIAGFTKYIDSLIGALPEKAFKFEKATLGLVAPNKVGISVPAGDGFNTDVYDALFADEAETTTEVAPTAEEAAATAELAAAQAIVDAAALEAAPEGEASTTGEAASGEGKEAAPASEGGEEAAPEQEAAPANLEELPNKGAPAPVDFGKELATALAGLTKTMGEQINTALAPINDRMKTQDASIAKMSKAMGSTVASTLEADDDNVIELAKGTSKSGGGVPPLMDTAYRSKG